MLNATYVDKGDYDCLDRNKTGHGVYCIAKPGLGEDSMVKGQYTGLDEEQGPWIYDLVCIPG